ncbi:hypothetical protein D3C71_216790 [compost metagenome]
MEEEVVAVGIREYSGELSCFIVPADGLHRAFLTAAFFGGDHAGFRSFLAAGTPSPKGHVPVGRGYVLLDFHDQRIVSFQTAASFDSLPRLVLEDIYESSHEDGAAVASAITHRDCMGDGRGKVAVGPFDGSEREAICGYANVHERFSTYYFEIPGWTLHQGILSPDAMRSAFNALDGDSILSEEERDEWTRGIASSENGGAMLASSGTGWKKEIR